MFKQNHNGNTNMAASIAVNVLRPWQQKAMDAIFEQDGRVVTIIFDFSGNSGKTNLLQYLRGVHNFQALYLAAPDVIFETINPSAKGYMADINPSDTARDFKKFGSSLESVKDKCFFPSMYHGRTKWLKEHFAVVFTGKLFNLNILPIDRWQFFHTRLGLIFLRCVSTGVNTFSFQIDAAENSVEDGLENHLLTEADNLTDEELFLQYIRKFIIEREEIDVLQTNKLAFPTIISEDAFKTICDMFYAEQYVLLHRYLVEGGFMEGSIVAHLFLDPNSDPVFYME